MKFKLPRFVNMKSHEDQILVLKRFRDSKLITDVTLSTIVAEKSNSDMIKRTKKALKNGEDITVEELVKPLKDSPEFLKFCEELGMNVDFFEGLAKEIIEVEKAKKNVA